jgi:hypothetical protein
VDLVVGVFFFALIFVPLGLIAWGCVRAYRGRSVSVNGSVALPLPPEQSAGHIVATMTPTLQPLNYKLISERQGGVLFQKKYKPIWLIILFFPLGLLALLYSKTISIAFEVSSQSSHRTEVEFLGQGPPHLQGEVLANLSGQALQP